MMENDLYDADMMRAELTLQQKAIHISQYLLDQETIIPLSVITKVLQAIAHLYDWDPYEWE